MMKHPLGNARKHQWLSQREMKTAGLCQISDTELDGMDKSEWDQATGRCRGCKLGADCPFADGNTTDDRPAICMRTNKL